MNLKRAWVIVCVTAWAVVALAFVIAASNEGFSLVDFFGDDAFYYAGTAEGLLRDGILSATPDSGAISNGWHAGWLALWTVTLGVAGSMEGAGVILTLVSLAAWAGIGYVIFAFSARLHHPVLGMFAGALWLGGISLHIALNGLESMLFVLVFALGLLRLQSVLSEGILARRGKGHHYPPVGFPLVDSALVLALLLVRSEGIVFLTLYALAVLVVVPFRGRWVPAATALASVGSFFLVNRFLFGAWSQSSTLFYVEYVAPFKTSIDKINVFLGAINTGPYAAIGGLPFAESLGLMLSAGAVTVLLLLLLSLMAAARKSLSGLLAASVMAAIAGLVASIGSLAYTSIVQGTSFSRYSITLLVPALIGWMVLLGYLLDKTVAARLDARGGQPDPHSPGLVHSAAILAAVAACVVAIAGVFGNVSSYLLATAGSGGDERRLFVQAGRVIADRTQADPSLALTGGWNSGIINYYSGLRVLNLDGRVNSDIFSDEYSGKMDSLGELRSYLQSKGIHTVVDGKGVVLGDLAVRYNTTPECLAEMFTPVERLAGDDESWYGGVWLFKVNPDVSPACTFPTL